MPNTIIPINKRLINKLRKETDAILTCVNGHTFNSNESFTFFTKKLIYSALETTYIKAFNDGLLCGKKLIK